MRRNTPLTRKTSLNVYGQSDTAQDKKEIQRLLREIVIKRDGGCILRHLIRPGIPACGGYRKDGQLILQADHLISRSNSATFADSRLVVCVCKGHHGWKSVGSNLRKAQYDELIKTILSPDRIRLWERCENDSWRATKQDWKIHIIALNQELVELALQDPDSNVF